MHAHWHTLWQEHTHTLAKRAFFSAFFCLLFALSPSLRTSLPPIPFPLASSVSISCDIPFCFLITALYFVLLVPNNFIDGGHKPIHSLSRAARRHEDRFMAREFSCHLLHASCGSLTSSFILQPWAGVFFHAAFKVIFFFFIGNWKHLYD